MSSIISIYSCAEDKKSQHTVYIDKVLEGIQSGKWKAQINYLRTLLGDDYDKEKVKLPCVTFSGVFSERLIECIIQHSGFIIIDIDKLEEQTMYDIKSMLSKDEFVYSVFVSPSKKGLKVLFKIGENVEDHKKYFLYIENYLKNTYGIVADKSGKDVCRLCFVSYDAKLYLNKDSKQVVIPSDFVCEINTAHVRPPEKFMGKSIRNDSAYIFDVCVKWAQRKFSYEKGQRNSFVHCIACGLNRCGVTQGDALIMIESTYTGMDQGEIPKIIRNAYFHNKSEFGTITMYDLDGTEQPDIENVPGKFDLNLSYEGCIQKLSMELFDKGVSNNEIAMMVPSTIKQVFAGTDYNLESDYIKQQMNIAWVEYKEKMQSECLPVSSASDIAFSIIEFVKASSGIKTAFSYDVDKTFSGGFQVGNSYGIIGVGGTYKSIIAQYIATENSKVGIPSLYLNGEMSKAQYYDRLLKKEFGLSILEISKMSGFESILTEKFKELDAIHNNCHHVTTLNPFSEKQILSTLDSLRIKYGQDVKLLVIDGIKQMEWPYRDEITSLNKNAMTCKEIAKKANEGRGVAVIFLSHVSGNISKHIRNTSEFTRGGKNMLTALDGFMCTSLCVDPINNTFENDEIIYLRDKIYIYAEDKRGSGATVSKIIHVDNPLKLSEVHTDPKMFEVKIEGRQK